MHSTQFVAKKQSSRGKSNTTMSSSPSSPSPEISRFTKKARSSLIQPIYVVATPIGNMEDISLRAMKMLLSADVIVAEDTRRTGILIKLLREKIARVPGLFDHNDDADSMIHELLSDGDEQGESAGSSVVKMDNVDRDLEKMGYLIKSKAQAPVVLPRNKSISSSKDMLSKTAKFMSFHEHNSSPSRAKLLLDFCLNGQKVVLVSDAGTPLISDPGSVLIQTAYELDVPVLAIPGPCAAIAALSVAGQRCETFVFAAFLPSKRNPRRDALRLLEQTKRCIVLYEAPHRLLKTLKDIQLVFEPNSVDPAVLDDGDGDSEEEEEDDGDGKDEENKGEVVESQAVETLLIESVSNELRSEPKVAIHKRGASSKKAKKDADMQTLTEMMVSQRLSRSGGVGRGISIVREITKVHEEVLRFNRVEQAVSYFKQVDPRGEIVVVISAPDSEGAAGWTDESGSSTANLSIESANAKVDVLIRALVENGASVSAISKSLAQVTGLPKSQLYKYTVQIRKQTEKGEEDHGDE